MVGNSTNKILHLSFQLGCAGTVDINYYRVFGGGTLLSRKTFKYDTYIVLIDFD